MIRRNPRSSDPPRSQSRSPHSNEPTTGSPSSLSNKPATASSPPAWANNDVLHQGAKPKRQHEKKPDRVVQGLSSPGNQAKPSSFHLRSAALLPGDSASRQRQMYVPPHKRGLEHRASSPKTADQQHTHEPHLLQDSSANSSAQISSGTASKRLSPDPRNLLPHAPHLSINTTSASRINPITSGQRSPSFASAWCDETKMRTVLAKHGENLQINNVVELKNFSHKFWQKPISADVEEKLMKNGRLMRIEHSTGTVAVAVAAKRAADVKVEGRSLTIFKPTFPGTRLTDISHAQQLTAASNYFKKQ